ncbi:hypothetical protein TomMM35A_03470 [Sphingobium sp. TomMM35A]
MNKRELLINFIEKYIENVLDGLDHRKNSKVNQPWYSGEVSSVLNGLLGRQATLSIKLAQSPTNWDGHIAPLVLRSMIDCHISFEWILGDPVSRSQEYIGYALGQAKLTLSHLEERSINQPGDEILNTLIEAKKHWIGYHKMLPFVEVNLGSWSGSSVRAMAKEIGDEDFYKYSFSPFSSCVHNTWEHIHLYNTIQCTNPLHKYHHLPSMNDAPTDPDYLYRSAKYVSMSFSAYDRVANVSGGPMLPKAFFNEHVQNIFDE